MRIMQTTQYLTPEDAELILGFLEDIRQMLLVNYGEEIRQTHRTLPMEEQEEPPNDD